MLGVALLLVLIGSAPIESTLAEESASKTSFTEAAPTKREPPAYPTSQRAANNAGVVELLVMVATDGAPFATMVTRSSKPQFEKAALNAIADYQFSPALLNGEPVESSYNLRIILMMQERSDAVTPKFENRYRAARAELEKELPNQEQAAGDRRRRCDF